MEVFLHNRTGSTRPVKLLPLEAARKIAAGEVIDRPASVLREFLDNAVDSGADIITVEINGGGIDSIRVTDNGTGMTKEDLIACAHPHTTSKIVNEKDLLSLHTLGFRGEALASIAAVSRLEITSHRKGTEFAWKMQAPLAGLGGKDNILTPSQLSKGTIVSSESLFEEIPARRLFLKRPAAETTLCKQVFIDKSIPYPEIAFRLIVDGKTKLDLPKTENIKDRYLTALEITEPDELFDFFTIQDKDFQCTLVLGDPEISKVDKKYIYTFVNGRRIQDFSLIQAIEYGATGFFPNGTHPVVALLIDINPELVDFNIHPAKKEVRFKDISPIHHSISTSVRNYYLRSSEIKNKNEEPIKSHQNNLFSAEITPIEIHESASFPNFEPSIHKQLNTSQHSKLINNTQITDSLSTYASKALSSTQITVEKTEDINYLGQLFSVFLVVEKNNTLYLIDQHAGHERILYDQFMETAGSKQPLLIPFKIETDNKTDDDYIERNLISLEEAGFQIKKREEGIWDVLSVPIKWKGNALEFREALLDNFIEAQEIIRTLAAYTSCKAAIKENTILDYKTGKELAEKILNLKDPHCPHGRPLWLKYSKNELYSLIKRS